MGYELRLVEIAEVTRALQTIEDAAARARTMLVSSQDRILSEPLFHRVVDEVQTAHNSLNRTVIPTLHAASERRSLRNMQRG